MTKTKNKVTSEKTNKSAQLMPFAGELPEVTAMPQKYNPVGFDRIIERTDPHGMTMYYYKNPDTGQEEMLKELGHGKYMTMDERSIFDVPKAKAIRAEQAKGTANDFDKVMLGTLALGTAPITFGTAASALPSLAPGSAFWTNPLTKQIMAGTTMGEGVNLGTKVLSGRNSFGQLVGDAVEDVSGWNPNNTWLGPIVTDALNPGWYRNPTRVMNAVERVGSAIERVPQVVKPTINRTVTTLQNKYPALFDPYTSWDATLGYHGDNIFSRAIGTISRRHGYTPKAEIPEFHRRLAITKPGSFRLTDDGKFIMSSGRTGEGHDGIVNFATSEAARGHNKHKYLSGINDFIIPSKVLKGVEFKSIQPSDTFFEVSELSINPKQVTLVSGNPETLKYARSLGMRTLSSPRLRNFNSLNQEGVRISGRVPVSKVGRFNFDKGAEYENSEEIGKEIQRLTSMRGAPTMQDYAFFENQTGLNSGVIPNTSYNFKNKMGLIPRYSGNVRSTPIFNNVIYDPATNIEAIYREAKIGKKPWSDYYEALEKMPSARQQLGLNSTMQSTPTVRTQSQTPTITAENASTKNSSIIRTVQDNGKIRLSLPSHTKDKPRQFVLEPQRNNKFYVHMRTWDGDHVPANLTNGEKQQLFDALYNELPDNAEILFPQSGPRNYATRGTVAGLQRLARDPRFTPGTKGTLQYFDKDGRTIKTYEGTSFIKVPTTTSKIRTKKQGGKMNIIEFLKNGSGIHIKKLNQGKFTDYCGGKVTSACIAKGKKSPNPVIRKRATFAANARKWKHKDGGLIAKALFGMSFNNLIKGVGNFVKNNKEGILNVAKQGISTIANNKLLSKQQKSAELAVELNSKLQYLDNYNNALAQQTDRSPIVNSFNANMIAQAATPGINAMAEYLKAQIKSNFGQLKRANTLNFISSFSNLFSTKKA